MDVSSHGSRDFRHFPSSNRGRSAWTVKKLSKKPEEFILSSREDAFFRDHKYDDYGDVGAAVKKYVDDFANERSRTTASKSSASVDDVAKFVERYPEFRQKSATVAKHVQLVHTLSKVINDRQLMKVSEIEQEQPARVRDQWIGTSRRSSTTRPLANPRKCA